MRYIIYIACLAAAKKEISTVETETKQAQMQMKHANAEVKRKQADLKKTDTAYKKDQAAHESHITHINKIKVWEWSIITGSRRRTFRPRPSPLNFKLFAPPLQYG